MQSNLGIKRAPCLVLGNFKRNLRLQKSEKGPTGRPRLRSREHPHSGNGSPCPLQLSNKVRAEGVELHNCVSDVIGDVGHLPAIGHPRLILLV